MGDEGVVTIYISEDLSFELPDNPRARELYENTTFCEKGSELTLFNCLGDEFFKKYEANYTHIEPLAEWFGISILQFARVFTLALQHKKYTGILGYIGIHEEELSRAEFHVLQDLRNLMADGPLLARLKPIYMNY